MPIAGMFRQSAQNCLRRVLPKWGRRLPEDLAPPFHPDSDFIASQTPKMLWIELTSTCPFDCVFCTRKTRHGAGQHLDFEAYRSIIKDLEAPEFIGLNYSGESIHYPKIAEAIELANATGASTELVTALSSISGSMLEAIVASGLDRLAVSLHTLDAGQYRQLYGFSSLEALKNRVADFSSIKQRLGIQKPRLDFCFVALHENLSQLGPVVRYAREAGASEVFVHPVIGRHAVPYNLSRELSNNRLQESFKLPLRNAVASARIANPEIPLTVLNPDIDPSPQIGFSPSNFAPLLPSGARIYSCDQSPFESVHVLANGDVVICEAHDEMPVGNLCHRSLREIWQSGDYREFRRKYAAGENPVCRDCVWKVAYLPGEWKSAIIAANGQSPQLLRGWHPQGRESVVWSKRESLLALRSAGGKPCLSIEGILPPAPAAKANALWIRGNHQPVGNIMNPGSDALNFRRTFPLRSGAEILNIEFKTEHVFRPAFRGINADQRDLGFALERIEIRRWE